MANCPKCGKELAEGITKCPECDVENIQQQNTIEEVQIDPNNIMSLDEEPKKELVEEVVSQSQNVEEPVAEEQPLEQELNKETITEENVTIEVQTQEPILEEPIVTNENLETVSVDATSITLETEPEKNTVIETPDMPEPIIAELNPEVLGSAYDEAERINNEKIEAKRKQELEELERKRQEEEAKRQAQAQAGKPDLLAGRNNDEINIEPMPKKKKTSKVLMIFLIIILLVAIAAAAYYFLVLKNH